MVLDRKTQQTISVADRILILQDKRGTYRIPITTITVVNYDNDGDSVTFSIQGDESTTYTIHRTDPFGNQIESDVTARDLAIRIITLLDS
jgi:hypothetical protein